MKTRIAVGAGLLLTLGTAMAGTLIYGQGQGRSATAQSQLTAATVAVDSQVTPEMLATWRAEAAADDYISPKVPL
jgi:hypothetical protein